MSRTLGERLLAGGGWPGVVVLFGPDVVMAALFALEAVTDTTRAEAFATLAVLAVGVVALTAALRARTSAARGPLLLLSVVAFTVGLIEGGFVLLLHAAVAGGSLLAADQWRRARDRQAPILRWAALTGLGLLTWTVMLLAGVALLFIALIAS